MDFRDFQVTRLEGTKIQETERNSSSVGFFPSKP